MGKLLGPKHVVSVSQCTNVRGSTDSNSNPQYLEGFDFFGHDSSQTPNLDNATLGSEQKRKSSGSFARVLHRQPSYTSAQLEILGESIGPANQGNIAEALKDLSCESDDESK